MTMSLEEAAQQLAECKRVEERIAAEIERLSDERSTNRARLNEACAVLGVVFVPARDIDSGKEKVFARVASYLDLEPNGVFSAKDVSVALNMPVSQVRTGLDRLIGQLRVERVSRGRFRRIQRGAATLNIPQEGHGDGTHGGGGAPAYSG